MDTHICPQCGHRLGLRFRGAGAGQWFWRCLSDEDTGVWCSYGVPADERTAALADAESIALSVHGGGVPVLAKAA